MKFTFCASALAVALLAAMQPAIKGQDDESLKKLFSAIQSFSIDLLTNLFAANPESNSVIAPGCIYISLALVYAGAGGETKNQLGSVLHIDLFEDDNEFYNTIKLLAQTVSTMQKGFPWKSASRLFGQEGFESTDEYVNKIEEYFPTEMETLDFSGDPSGSRDRINDWVSGNTAGKIQDLFPEDTITSDTHLVLASAVSFNTTWKYRFDKKSTKSQTFTTASNEKVKVPMMNVQVKSGLNYIAKPDLQLLELPSSGGTFSTGIILLKNSNGGDAKQRRRALETSEQEIMHDGQRQNVSVRLSFPKFTLSPTVDLKEALQALGLEDLFNPDTADLSDIDPGHAVPLDQAMHKTYIAFNEEGQQAAWSTENLLRRKFQSSMKQIDFIVDSPFLFFIFEKESKCILFEGYVANPLQSD